MWIWLQMTQHCLAESIKENENSSSTELEAEHQVKEGRLRELQCQQEAYLNIVVLQVL